MIENNFREQRTCHRSCSNTIFTYSVEPVVDEMFQVFAHPDLPHQLVLVAIHAGQLTYVGKDVLQPVGQLKHRNKSRNNVSV